MGAKEIAREKYLVLFQVCPESLRPVNPGNINEFEGFIAQRERFAVLDGNKAVVFNIQQVNQHLFALGICHYLRIREHQQDIRQRP